MAIIVRSLIAAGAVVKQPGSANIYLVFTLGAQGTGSLNYSTVDMTLAGGNGSVTIKNTLLALDMTENLTSTRHCNGIDFWLIAHDHNSDNFRCFLVTSAGVNPTPESDSRARDSPRHPPANGPESTTRARLFTTGMSLS